LLLKSREGKTVIIGVSLQAAFSQQKLHLKSPSEHSGNAQAFTNQFAKLAWLEIMLLCMDPDEGVSESIRPYQGSLPVQRKETSQTRM
jgi:hypothetical protein